MGQRTLIARGRRVAAVAALATAATLVSAPAALSASGDLGTVFKRAASTQGTSNNSVVTATASCPGKTKAFGGGFTAPFSSGGGSSKLIPLSSLRSGQKSWTASAWVFNGPATLTTFVYCRSYDGKVKSTTKSTSISGNFTTGTVSAKCSKKKGTLISGGFSSSVGTLASDSAQPYVSLGSGKTWTYSAVNNGGTAHTLKVQAYCAKDVKRSFVTGTNSATIGSGSSVPASSAPCSGSKRLSGGGFSASPTPATGGLSPAISENRINGGAWLATVTQAIGGLQATTVTSQGVCTG